MVTVLALSAAMAYGVADFLGGAVARRSTTLHALAWCVPIGLAVVLAAALLAGGDAAPGPMAWGSVGGVGGGTGLIVFYRALARGPMNVVAPVSALAAAVLPVVVGVARGERLDMSVLLGVLLCLVAIGLVSLEAGKGEAAGASASGWRRLLDSGPFMAAVSGACFGIFYVMLNVTGDDAGLWPLVGARVGTLSAVAVALAVVALRGGGLGPRMSGWTLVALALLSGALDALANGLYFIAAQRGMLSLAAVLSSLYPAVTVLLARVAYSERLRAVQRVGMAVAVAGVALVTVG